MGASLLTAGLGGVHAGGSGQAGKWEATGSVEYLAGSERQIGELGFTLPVWQDLDSLLFADFRGRLDDADNDELNFGLAGRNLVGGEWILGAYGFYDRKQSAFGNAFDQLTLGVELLGQRWDFRVNGYLPEAAGKASPDTRRVTLEGDRIFVAGAMEQAYAGVDYEVGRLLCSFGERANEVRAFAGGYYFDAGAEEFPQIAGVRGRIELRLFDPVALPVGSRLKLSGEVQWDEVRQTQGFAGLQVQIPLGRGEVQGSGDGNEEETVSGGPGGMLERRMVDPIVRDVDVVTQLSGREIARAAGGGPAVLANQDTSLATAVKLAGPGGTVVVYGAVSTPGDVRLQHGQHLTSGAATVRLVGEHSGIEWTQALPHRPGVITGTDSGNPILILTDRVTVDHLVIRGGRDGLFAPGDLDHCTIADNVIAGAAWTGICLSGDFSGAITGNTLERNRWEGISIEQNLGEIRGNSALHNQGAGFSLFRNEGIIADNLAVENGRAGFVIANGNAGSITGNFASGNGRDGFEVAGGNRGQMSSNQAQENGASGFYLHNEHFVTPSPGGLIQLPANSGAFLSNTAIANGVDGSLTRRDGFTIDGISTGELCGNTASGNWNNGFAAEADGVIRNQGAFRNNASTGNGDRGYRVVTSGPGTKSGNTGSGNAGGGNTP